MPNKKYYFIISLCIELLLSVWARSQHKPPPADYNFNRVLNRSGNIIAFQVSLRPVNYYLKIHKIYVVTVLSVR